MTAVSRKYNYSHIIIIIILIYLETDILREGKKVRLEDGERTHGLTMNRKYKVM